MTDTQIIPGKIYDGYVIDDKEHKNKDPKNFGRYRIYIPSLSPGPETKEDEGFWVRNRIGNNLVSSNEGSYGSYFPQQPKSGKNDNKGTQVKVSFDTKDPQSGQIITTVTDHTDGATPKIISKKTSETPSEDDFDYLDRDRTFVVVKTPNDNTFVILEKETEGSAESSKGSININFQGKQSTIVINDDGIHLYTDNNLGITVKEKNSILIEGDSKIQVNGDSDLYCNGTTKIYSSSNIEIKSDATVNIEGSSDVNVKGGSNVNVDGGTVNVKGGGSINMQAGMIHLNGSAPSAASAAQASENKGEDEVVEQNKVSISK
jgi:hypothetical protein